MNDCNRIVPFVWGAGRHLAGEEYVYSRFKSAYPDECDPSRHANDLEWSGITMLNVRR